MKEYLIEYNNETTLFEIYELDKNEGGYWYVCEVGDSELLKLIKRNKEIKMYVDENEGDLFIDDNEEEQEECTDPVEETLRNILEPEVERFRKGHEFITKRFNKKV